MIRRTRIKAKRSKPRRGRVVDKDFLAWMELQPCLVHGYGCVAPIFTMDHTWMTTHHVRKYGSPKNDRRVLRLCAPTHQETADSKQSIEALGKEAWQKLHGVDIEAAIADYNARYESERAA